MSITRLDPATLPQPIGYSQITVAEGTRIVHVSGQVGVGLDGAVAGPDHRSQAEQALRNLVAAYEAVGATQDDVAKVTFYIAEYGPEALGALFEASAAVLGADFPTPATTLIGVAALADPSHLIEVEATLVLA